MFVAGVDTSVDNGDALTLSEGGVYHLIVNGFTNWDSGSYLLRVLGLDGAVIRIIPESSALSLLLLAALGLVAVRRRSSPTVR